MTKPSSKSVFEEAAGGLSAGIVGTVLGYPLDVIKTRLQTSKTNDGMLATGRLVVQKEGILSLYKGITPPLISLSILNTTTFALYSYFQHLLNAQRGWDIRNSLSGALCGPLCAPVSTVENLLKTQMQVDNVSNNRFKGSLDCARQLVKEHGILVLYKGHMINTVREVTFLTTYFGVYEGLRSYLSSILESGKNSNISKLYVPIAGGMSGALAWTVSFPLDCIRAGVQGSNIDEKKTARTVYKDLMSTKGIKGLYSGVTPSITRAFLVSGSRFSAYEAALWLIRGGRDVAE